MWAKLATWLRQLADWASPPQVYDGVVLRVPYGELLSRAKVLVLRADQEQGAGWGESKRHRVYAQLIKEFPDTSRRHLALVIEAALDELWP